MRIYLRVVKKECLPCVLADTLGVRLEAQGTEKHRLQACLCYICSGNIEKLVECWVMQRDCSSPLVLEVRELVPNCNWLVHAEESGRIANCKINLNSVCDNSINVQRCVASVAPPFPDI